LLWLAAATFSVGAGLRPSDGLFLLPMLAYYFAHASVLFCRPVARMKAVLFLCLVAVLCLAWIIPTGLAYHEALGRVPGLDQTPIGAQGGTSAYVGRIVRKGRSCPG